MKKDGFTLVELLIAVAIVAALTAIGLGVYSSVSKDNRDQKRISDLTSVKQALELFRHNYGYYPYYSVTDNWSQLGTDLRAYISSLPNDPSASTWTYVYVPGNCSSSRCSSFVLCARKEGGKSYDNPTSCAVSCGGGNCQMGVASE